MLVCPYCNNNTSVPEDCREQDTPYEAQCETCEMVFVFYVSYYPSYSEHIAPCKNGGEHNLQPVVGLPAEFYADKRICTHCGEKFCVTLDNKTTPW